MHYYNSSKNSIIASFSLDSGVVAKTIEPKM